MSRPKKRIPGHTEHHIYNLLDGKASRKIFLPPHVAGAVNQVLKHHDLSYRLLPYEDKLGVKRERSN